MYEILLLLILIILFSCRERFSISDYKTSMISYPSNYDVPNIDNQAVYSDIISRQEERDNDLFGRRLDFKIKKNALRGDLIHYVP